MIDTNIRCTWAGNDPLYIAYHDQEWGVPVHDDHLLFEFLILEGTQAGLSWITILRKRANYRRAFDDFDPVKVAHYRQRKVTALLNNNGIVRNRLKIAAAVNNAQRFLEVQAEFDSFDRYLWGFVDNRPVQNNWRRASQIPATTPQSDSLSKDMKKRGFKFVGSTICYAFMQAVGLVNDHITSCLRHRPVARLR